MSVSEDDRRRERERYDARARDSLSRPLELAGTDGASSVPVEIRAPYIEYERQILRHGGPGKRLLDVCCGDGRLSLVSAQSGCLITVSDLAPSSVELATQRALRRGINVSGLVANAEELPLPNDGFDIVTCAGGLSYLDHQAFFSETARILRPGGVFVAIDSLNHNPIYRLNRFWHFLRGRRTRSTLRQMPTMATFRSMQENLGPILGVRFFGTAVFLAPLMKMVASPERTARLLDRIDRVGFIPRALAFKFVVVVQKSRTLP